MFKKKNNNQRFMIKSTDNVRTLGRVIVLVDRQTGVNYIQTWVGASGGITPLLNEHGQVIVDPVENEL